MPGLINAHHHLYSTFARGFTPPGPLARNFEQNLKNLWWKLDAALESEDVYYSALLALMDSARAGCTTDHRSSRLTVLLRRQPRSGRTSISRCGLKRLSLLRSLGPQ